MGLPGSAWRHALAGAVLLASLQPAPTRAQDLDPVVYTVRVPDPALQIAHIEASLPTDGRPSLEVMMPIRTPGYYRVEDHAGKVASLSARTPDGRALDVAESR